MPRHGPDVLDHENIGVPEGVEGTEDAAGAVAATEPPNVARAFEEQARRAPNREALVFGDRTWTFADLDHASERVARSLLNVGTRRGDRVGMAMDRSPESVATLLGITRAGAAVVPLDTSYPAPRLRSMVEQADPVRIITHEHHSHLVEDGERLLTVESLFDGSISAGGTENLTEEASDLPDIAPEDEAYVLFTSGSTGQPKGVAMPHRALANLVAWQNSTASGTRGGRTLQFAPVSFDVSFQEVYSTLCAGHALVLVTEELRRDMPGLLRLMDEQAVERVFLPYVALQRMAEAANATGVLPRGLRVLVSSGEQLRVTDEIRQLCSALGDVILENQYGPTESHVVTAYTMVGDPASFPAMPPIGTAIYGSRALVLDERMRQVPVGGKGEIHLGGVCLADGYVGRPDLTGERFLGSGRERLYRTGDVGMVLPGGDVVCLGRSDRQVKVRGFRVEPAEVEMAVGETATDGLAAIREVAVVARSRGGQDTFLAAFLVGDAERSDLDGLRHRLRSELPDYMVPSHFEWISALPLTPSGKRDDDALRESVLTRGDVGGHTAPRDDLESTLAEMLADLLGVEGLGVHDNVFELGATSITAMRLVVLIEQRYGVSVPLSEFVSTPTVAGLAARVSGVANREGSSSGEFDPLVPFRSEGDRPPLFYVHPMGGNVLCYVPFVQHLPEGQPFYALQAAGTDAGTAPVRGVEEMAKGYVEAIRRVQPEGPYHIGGWSYGGFVAFEMARQLRAAEQEVASLVLLDTTALNPGRRPWTDDDALIGWFFWELLWLERGGDSPEVVIPEEVTTLDEKFDFITRLAVEEGVLPPGSNEAIVRRLFRLYETNWRSAFAYRPEGVEQDTVLIHACEPLPDVLRRMRSMAHDISHRAVVVTGASSGLGRECALDLEDRGFQVVAGVRRVEDGEKLLAESTSGRITYQLLDVTDDDSVADCARHCEREFGELWGLVNNAGICISSPLECVDSERMRRQLDTNVVGQLAMIRAHLPLLRRSRGRIVNVTSGLGRVAVPYMGAYAAAQFAKEALSDALRREVASSGVRVSVVQPGAILTPIWGKVSEVGADALRSAPTEIAALYRLSFQRFLESNSQQAAHSRTTPEEFATAVARALSDANPRTRYRVGRDSRLVNAMSRALPDRLIDRYFAKVVSG